MINDIPFVIPLLQINADIHKPPIVASVLFPEFDITPLAPPWPQPVYSAEEKRRRVSVRTCRAHITCV